MKKSFKNRGIFAKLILIGVVITMLVATLIGVTACNKPLYENETYTTEFSDKQVIFTLPSDAKIIVRRQSKYFVFEDIKPKATKQIGELTQYVFTNDPKQTFRIEREGFVTKAGYFQTSGNYIITAQSKQDVWERQEYTENLPNNLAGIDDNMLTNIGDNYFKILDVGESFDLRAWRNWMIIDNSSSNIEIEPTFDCEVLHGDSVSVERKNENSFSVTALKEGVTQLRLKYQAIEILNKDKWFKYNASDKNREAVITFAVGEKYTNDMQVQINGKQIDCEFDTINFVGDSGKVNLTTNAEEVFCNGIEIAKGNNNFELQVKVGANIIELKKSDKSQFLTIYGNKIDIKIERNEDNLSFGDKISLSIVGLNLSMPKMGGIYNPAQKFSTGNSPTNGSRLQMTMANGDILEAIYVSQYYHSANTTFEIEYKEEYLINGKLTFDLSFCAEWWGSELGTHRAINANGMESNLNAKFHTRSFGIFENIVVEL